MKNLLIQVPYVWRRSNKELLAKNMKPTVKYGGNSVMVRVSFSASGPNVVDFIDGTIDQHIYLNILKESLPLCKQKLYLLFLQ